MAQKRPEVKARGRRRSRSRRRCVDWIEARDEAGQPGAWRRRSKTTGDPDLKQALAWSKAVNETVADMVRGVPPFPFVRESLEKLGEQGRHAGRLGHAAGSRSKPNGTSTTSPSTCGRSAARKSARRRRSLASGRQVRRRPHADDRRRPRRLQGGRGQRLPVLPDQSRRTKRPVGSGSTTKAIDRFLAGHVRRRLPGDNCSTSSTATCPNTRRGRSDSK